MKTFDWSRNEKDKLDSVAWLAADITLIGKIKESMSIWLYFYLRKNGEVYDLYS